MNTDQDNKKIYKKLVSSYIQEGFDILTLKKIPIHILKEPLFLHAFIDYLEKINQASHTLTFYKFLYTKFREHIPEDIMVRGISLEGKVIQYANIKVCSNFDYGMIAVTNNGFSLGNLSEELRNNKDIVQAAVLNNVDFYDSIFHLAGKEIQNELKGINSYTYFSKKVFSEQLNQDLSPNSVNTKRNKI